MTKEEKKQKRRKYNENRKKKRQQEAKKIKASKALIMLNRPYSYEDAETYGKYIKSDTHFKLVECKESEIEGAGIGVFACVDLEVDDIVTFYTGTFVKEEPKDRKAVEYSIAVNGGYLLGIQKPQVGKGVASFINRECRKLKKWKNCELTLGSNGRSVYARLTKNVPTGKELITCYGFGYLL